MIEIVVSIKEPLAEGKIYSPSSGSGLRGNKLYFTILCQLHSGRMYIYTIIFIFMYFLYSEIVLISGGKCRNYIHIDWNKVMTNHELTITPRCLMDRTRSLYSGYKGKSKLRSALKKCAGINFSTFLS